MLYTLKNNGLIMDLGLGRGFGDGDEKMRAFDYKKLCMLCFQGFWKIFVQFQWYTCNYMVNVKTNEGGCTC